MPSSKEKIHKKKAATSSLEEKETNDATSVATTEEEDSAAANTTSLPKILTYKYKVEKFSKNNDEFACKDQHISKRFGKELYHGIIDGYLEEGMSSEDKNCYWHVTYDDGDHEHLKWEELEKGMKLYHKYQERQKEKPQQLKHHLFLSTSSSATPSKNKMKKKVSKTPPTSGKKRKVIDNDNDEIVLVKKEKATTKKKQRKTNKEFPYANERVSKYFDEELFHGIITDCYEGQEEDDEEVDATPEHTSWFWHVIFDDGDEEDWDILELEVGLKLHRFYQQKKKSNSGSDNNNNNTDENNEADNDAVVPKEPSKKLKSIETDCGNYYEVDTILDRRLKKMGRNTKFNNDVYVTEYLVKWKEAGHATADSWLPAESLDHNSLLEAFQLFPPSTKSEEVPTETKKVSTDEDLNDDDDDKPTEEKEKEETSKENNNDNVATEDDDNPCIPSHSTTDVLNENENDNINSNTIEESETEKKDEITTVTNAMPNNDDDDEDKVLKSSEKEKDDDNGDVVMETNDDDDEKLESSEKENIDKDYDDDVIMGINDDNLEVFTVKDKRTTVAKTAQMIRCNKTVYRIGESYCLENDDNHIVTILDLKIIGREHTKEIAICRRFIPQDQTLLPPQNKKYKKLQYVQYGNDKRTEDILLKHFKGAVRQKNFRSNGWVFGFNDELKKDTNFSYYLPNVNATTTNIHTTNNNKRPRVLELFAGAGGMCCGFHNAGMVTKWAVEKNESAAATLKANWPNVEVYTEDVVDFLQNAKRQNGDDSEDDDTNSGRKRRKQPNNENNNPTTPSAYPRPDEVDHIHASPPCQGFSRANRHGGDEVESNNNLSLEFIKFMEYYQPKTATYENVPGLLLKQNNSYLQEIVSDLLALNYQLRIDILKSSNYGDPQHRRRVILWASKVDVPLPQLPKRTHGGSKCTDLFRYRTVKDAIGCLAKYESSLEGRSCLNFSNNNNKIEHHFCMLTTQQPDPDDGVTYVLRANRPSRTITGCQAVHYNAQRYLTIREAALLQSFPWSYRFFGSMHDQFRQVGNAVPVYMATAVAKSVAKVYGLPV